MIDLIVAEIEYKTVRWLNKQAGATGSRCVLTSLRCQKIYVRRHPISIAKLDDENKKETIVTIHDMGHIKKQNSGFVM